MSNATPRAAATKRDVYWCFSVTIIVSVLAIVIAVGRTQQLADARIADRDLQTHQREVDQRAQTAALALALQQSNYQDCRRGNRNTGKLLSYVDGQVARQRASYTATAASRSASVQMKQTAARNLLSAIFQQLQLHAALQPDVCTKPRAP